MRKQFQQGLSSLGLLVVLAVAGFFLLTAFKLGPLYIDNYFVRAAVESMQEEKIDNMTDGEIRRKLSGYFTINNVRDIDMRSVKIERDSSGTKIMVDYEKRINFLANVDVVVKFANHFDTSQY